MRQRMSRGGSLGWYAWGRASRRTSLPGPWGPDRDLMNVLSALRVPGRWWILVPQVRADHIASRAQACGSSEL